MTAPVTTPAWQARIAAGLAGARPALPNAGWRRPHRSWWGRMVYRGHHRTGYITVADLLATHEWHLPGRAIIFRSLLTVASLQKWMGSARRIPYKQERAALESQYQTQMNALGLGGDR